MKNMDSKARTQVIFGTLLFALVLMAGMYTMINFPQMYIVLVALAVVDLVCLYVIISGWMIIQESKSQKWEERYECIFKSEKASYLLMKKNFEELGEKLDHLSEIAEIPTEEIVNAQKAAARVVINRCRDNTTTLMRSNEQAISGIGEIKSTFSEFQNVLLSLQQDLEESNDKMFQMRMQEMTVTLKDMELRLNNAIMQSQKVIAQAPVITAPVQQTVPVQMQAAEPEAVPVSVEEPEAEAIMPEAEEIPEAAVEAPEPELTEMEEPETAEPEEMEEPEEPIEPDMTETKEEAAGEIPEEEPESEPEKEKPPLPDLSDPDKTLDASEIDALFADMEIELGTVSKEEAAEETAEPEPEEIAESEEAEPEESEEEPEEPAMPDLSDPNKALDPAEIDALFASMNAEMEADKKPEEEPVAEEEAEPEEPAESMESGPEEPEAEEAPVIEEEPEAEEIPAAGEEPEPAESVESEPEEEPEESAPEPEEKPAMPDLSDPNKALDADEIAALFANMGGESAPEPEPEEEKPPMPDLSDPNKALDADEIAALFANMGS